MKKILLPFILLSFVLVNQKSYAHCEIPCGIYGDELRIAMLYEHFTTIEKAMNKIVELSNASEEDYMMITRWTIAKEEHAKEIQHVANQYFLTQRVIPVEEDDAENYSKYQQQLMLLHHIIVYAMKAKQTTDVKYVGHLRTTLAQFEEVYFEGKHRHKIEQDDH
jgi:nickel superoxide dismutase